MKANAPMVSIKPSGLLAGIGRVALRRSLNAPAPFNALWLLVVLISPATLVTPAFSTMSPGEMAFRTTMVEGLVAPAAMPDNEQGNTEQAPLMLTRVKPGGTVKSSVPSVLGALPLFCTVKSRVMRSPT